jgi:parallel beta-helix repeat protein
MLRNAHAGHSSTDDKGNPATYVNNAACIHVEERSHIEIVNNVLTGCGNGIFVTPGVEEVLIERNYIYGNGNVSSIYEHNTYTEALGTMYRFNRFGPLCQGCGGNNLKIAPVA